MEIMEKQGRIKDESRMNQEEVREVLQKPKNFIETQKMREY